MVDIYERAGKTAEATADIIVKGAGAATGAIVASLVGGVIERGVLGQVTPTSTNMRKLGAYLLNNAPKGLGAYIAHEYNPSKGKGAVGDFIDGTSYGAAADIVFDTLGRARNKWAPGVTTLATAAGINNENQPDYNAITEKMHQLLMDNATLKQQVAMGSQISQENAALKQQIAMGSQMAQHAAVGSPGAVHRMITPPNRPLERGYQFTQPSEGQPGGYPGSSGIERQFEFTEPPVPGVVKERRPVEKQFQFTTPSGKVLSGSATDINVLSNGFGFIV